MNVRQIIELLSQYPEEMDVFFDAKSTEFTYGLVNEVDSKVINFLDGPGGRVLATDTVVILSED